VFADGCALAKLGAVVEIIGVGYLFLLVELMLLDPGIGRSIARIGPGIGFPFLIFLLVGTGMMGVAKLRMSSLPPSSGASGVMAGAAGLTALRFLQLLAATVHIGSALSGSRDVESGQSVAYAIGALLASWALGTLAEFTLVPGIAAVASVLPDKNLRMQAVSTGVMFQIQGLIIILLMTIGYFSGASDLMDRQLAPGRSAKTAIVWLVLFGIQVWFTYAQYSLYAAAVWAARHGRRDT
jgi:hypothetical protein